MGTGKACAWQSNPTVDSTSRSKILPLESDEKTGALKPTGSAKIGIFLWQFYKV